MGERSTPGGGRQIADTLTTTIHKVFYKGRGQSVRCKKSATPRAGPLKSEGSRLRSRTRQTEADGSGELMGSSEERIDNAARFTVPDQ